MISVCACAAAHAVDAMVEQPIQKEPQARGNHASQNVVPLSRSMPLDEPRKSQFLAAADRGIKEAMWAGRYTAYITGKEAQLLNVQSSPYGSDSLVRATGRSDAFMPKPRMILCTGGLVLSLLDRTTQDCLAELMRRGFLVNLLVDPFGRPLEVTIGFHSHSSERAR